MEEKKTHETTKWEVEGDVGKALLELAESANKAFQSLSRLCEVAADHFEAEDRERFFRKTVASKGPFVNNISPAKRMKKDA